MKNIKILSLLLLAVFCNNNGMKREREKLAFGQDITSEPKPTKRQKVGQDYVSSTSTTNISPQINLSPIELRRKKAKLKRGYEASIPEKYPEWIQDYKQELIQYEVVSADEINKTLKSLFGKLYEEAMEEDDATWMRDKTDDLIKYGIVMDWEIDQNIQMFGDSRAYNPDKAKLKEQKRIETVRKKTLFYMMQDATPNDPKRALVHISNLYKEIVGNDVNSKALDALITIKKLDQLYLALKKIETIRVVYNAVGQELGMLRGYMRYRTWIIPEKLSSEEAFKIFKTMRTLKDINAMIDLYENYLKGTGSQVIDEAYSMFCESIQNNDTQAIIDLYLNILKGSSKQGEALAMLTNYDKQLVYQHDEERRTRIKVCFEDICNTVMNGLTDMIPGIQEILPQQQNSMSTTQLMTEYETARANNNLAKLLELKEQLISSGIIPDAETFEAIMNSLLDEYY